MTDEAHREAVHPKDRVPPEEGIVVPIEELDLVNDHAPTEGVDPMTSQEPVPERRPTDGPL